MNDITTPKLWKDKKAVLKAQFPDLREEDLTYTGDIGQLISNIQRKVQKPRAEIKQLIKSI